MYQSLSTKTKKIIAIVLLLLVAILSCTVVTNYTTSPDVHADFVETLDQKKIKAMELTAGLAISSTALAAIPGDSTTPIATQLAELADIILVIIAVIYLEKFLLTTIGYVSFSFLIPIACAIFVYCIISNTTNLRKLGAKLVAFAIAIYLIIPTSVKLTDTIDSTFNQSMQATVETTEELKDAVGDGEEENFWQKVTNTISTTVTDIGEKAENALSVFVDAIAVSIITTCCIPLAVIFFAIWIIKILFSINIELPKQKIGFISNNKFLKNKQAKKLSSTDEDL